MTRNMTILTGLVGLSVCALLTGCKNKLPQGKFTEEQMKTIPYANKYELPAASGGMTLRIFSETVTVDEILQFGEEKLKPYAGQVPREDFQARALPMVRETVRGKVTDILLYHEARKQAPENIDDTIDKAVEAEIARFVAGYDNNYALAEQAIKKMGMDWKSFRDYQKKLLLTQSYVSSTLNEEKRYSYQDMVDYYESVKDEQFTKTGYVTFSLIDIQPEQLTADQIKDGQTPQAAAERIARRLLDQITAGADFAQLAKQHSHGPFADQGGRLQPVTLNTESLAEPYATLEKQAVRMQPGQAKGPITLDGHVFILQLNELEPGGVQPFHHVQKQIEQQLQFRHRRQQYQEMVQKLIEKTDVVQLERFAEFCVNEAYNRWGRES